MHLTGRCEQALPVLKYFRTIQVERRDRVASLLILLLPDLHVS